MKKKPKFKILFFQDWGTFSNETLVCVGASKQEILTFMKANAVKPELIKLFEHKREPKDTSSAFVWTPDDSGCTLLWIRDWTGSPDDLDTLVHETNHLVYEISRDKGFKDEPEIQAYQQAYLFSGILETLTARKSRNKKRKTNGNKNS